MKNQNEPKESDEKNVATKDKPKKRFVCDGHSAAFDGLPTMYDGYQFQPSGCAGRTSQAGRIFAGYRKEK